MLNMILSIIGIILIIYSVYIIRKDFLKDNRRFKELSSMEKSIKNDYNSTNEIISSFNELIELKLESMDEETKTNADTSSREETSKMNIDEKLLKLNHTNKKMDPTHTKIIELLRIGLTKEEIAKRMNKGIREVEIIIKMHNK